MSVVTILQGAVGIGLFILILGILVLIHEIGHFVTARRAGVRVHEFGIGFPPRAKVLRSDGETLYSLNWLPIGGFVKLEGEDGDSDDPRSFTRAPFLTKQWILSAGVLMNLLLALVLMVGVAWIPQRILALGFETVQPDSPAAGAGLVSVEFLFDGEAAHGAGSPWDGRSALDAVELMNVGWNYRREHLPLQQRSHYVITDGGDQPNVVPPTASWKRRSSERMRARSSASRLESGSSRSSTRGSTTSARASATRCCWPPLSCAGARSASPSNRVTAITRSIFSLISVFPSLRSLSP